MREDCNRAEVYLDILGHDINNLNQAITSYSELLLLKPNLPKQYKKYLQTTFNQSQAISDLISNVRKLSQLKKENFELKNIDIFGVLATASEKVQQTYPFRRFRINQSISESEVIVQSNEMLIYVFINLLNNAVKFDQNNEVVLDISHSLTEDKKFWKIEFKDSGLGVPDILKLRIFKEFEKGDESIRGSGLGLVVVKEIVKSSGGKVWVENKVRGDSSKGSNFIILLPKAN
jgi:signal transduction histidine kinase